MEEIICFTLLVSIIILNIKKKPPTLPSRRFSQINGLYAETTFVSPFSTHILAYKNSNDKR